MMNYLFQALLKKYEGDIETAKANLKVYESNPAGIGEHPDIVEECSKLVKDIAEAREMSETLRSLSTDTGDDRIK